jgi:hypothetical protein
MFLAMSSYAMNAETGSFFFFGFLIWFVCRLSTQQKANSVATQAQRKRSLMHGVVSVSLYIKLNSAVCPFPFFDRAQSGGGFDNGYAPGYTTGPPSAHGADYVSATAQQQQQQYGSATSNKTNNAYGNSKRFVLEHSRFSLQELMIERIFFEKCKLPQTIRLHMPKSTFTRKLNTTKHPCTLNLVRNKICTFI